MSKENSTPSLHTHLEGSEEAIATLESAYHRRGERIDELLAGNLSQLEEINALNSIIHSAPHQLLQVKPLEWDEKENGDFIAVSVVGWYHVGLPASYWSATTPAGDVLSGFHSYLDAQAAAQSDYESLIFSALAAKASGGLNSQPK